jgi:hypothetical protein
LPEPTRSTVSPIQVPTRDTGLWRRAKPGRTFVRLFAKWG